MKDALSSSQVNSQVLSVQNLSEQSESSVALAAAAVAESAMTLHKHVMIVRPQSIRGTDRLTNGCKPDGQRD